MTVNSFQLSITLKRGGKPTIMNHDTALQVDVKILQFPTRHLVTFLSFLTPSQNDHCRRGNSSKMKTPPVTAAPASRGEPGVGAGKSIVDPRVDGLTAFDAFEAQLKGLCLKEYPCGIGSWVRTQKEP